MTRDRAISYVTVQVQSLQLIQHLLELFQVEALVAVLVMPVTSGELKKDPTPLTPRDLQVVQDCLWDRNPLEARPIRAQLGEIHSEEAERNTRAGRR
jgi:hypothetical protein